MKIIKTEQNGIEFYTNSTTGESGMSVRGLARACGASPGGVSDIVQGVRNKVPKKLETLAIRLLEVSDKNGAVIVSDETCAELIYYYALECSKPREAAQITLKAFTKLGLRKFIQSVTGWQAPKPTAMPTYEKTISTFLNDFYDGSIREYRLPSGRRIDFVEDNTLIEVKRIEHWERAVGQILNYKDEYLETTGKRRCRTELVLFGATAEKERIRRVAKRAGVNKVRFFTDILLLEDRR